MNSTDTVAQKGPTEHSLEPTWLSAEVRSIGRHTSQFGDVEGCRLDDSPVLMRYGGAGIHFMFIGGRYRASFNFLEYPRLVIGLKVNKGRVRDVAFSTRRPDEVMKLLQEVIAQERVA